MDMLYHYSYTRLTMCGIA
uniref:Uncharacterized protein n=1 Tax=Rhizophora mucronata TaxID=61149 RepID=A0A2P2P8K2_RHIMU